MTTDNAISQGWFKLGDVPVGTGQLLLTDPAVIDEAWTDRPFHDIRQYRHRASGAQLEYRKDFAKFSEFLPAYGKSMNELLAGGEWDEVHVEVPPGLNYDACARTTINSDGGNVADCAVVFSTGYGDGLYPVYAKRNEEGRIVQVLVDFANSPAEAFIRSLDAMAKAKLPRH